MTPVCRVTIVTPSTFTRRMDTHIDLAIARIAEAHHGVFALITSSSFKCLGDRAKSSSRLRTLGSPPTTGVYRIAGAPQSWKGDLLAACWAGGTRAVASHRSAAALWDLPGTASRDRGDHVSSLAARTARWPRSCTRPRLERARHHVVDGIPVTTVERTIFDLAAVCSRFTVDLAIDSALRQKLTTVDELGAMLRRVGRRGLQGHPTLARPARRPRRELRAD